MSEGKIVSWSKHDRKGTQCCISYTYAAMALNHLRHVPTHGWSPENTQKRHVCTHRRTLKVQTPAMSPGMSSKHKHLVVCGPPDDF